MMKMNKGKYRVTCFARDKKNSRILKFEFYVFLLQVKRVTPFKTIQFHSPRVSFASVIFPAKWGGDENLGAARYEEHWLGALCMCLISFFFNQSA